MFTSRAEHRLLLRIDNADLRLTPRGREAGLVDDERWEGFCERKSRFESNLRTLDATFVRSPAGDRVPASQLLRQPQVRLERLASDGLVPLDIHDATAAVDLASVETTVKYAGYLKRQESEIERARRDERRRIPRDFPFDRVPGLSREIVQRLTQVQPDTLGHALRDPGRDAGGGCGAVRLCRAAQPVESRVAQISNPNCVQETSAPQLQCAGRPGSTSTLPAAVLEPLETLLPPADRWNARINLTALRPRESDRGDARPAARRAARGGVARPDRLVHVVRSRVRRRLACHAAQAHAAPLEVDDGGFEGAESGVSARSRADAGPAARAGRERAVRGAAREGPRTSGSRSS